jgi:hypothetical protein
MDVRRNNVLPNLVLALLLHVPTAKEDDVRSPNCWCCMTKLAPTNQTGAIAADNDVANRHGCEHGVARNGGHETNLINNWSLAAGLL